jgi:DNA repair exonuclease SbcCD ATPase subunit
MQPDIDGSQSRKGAMRIAQWSLVILLAVPIGVASAAPRQQAQQSNSTDQDSLAAAAKRAREQKKDAPKAAKVWSNDDIPAAGAVSVVGQPGSESSTTESTAAAPASTGQPATPEEKQALEGNVSSAKDKLADLKSELDILQRKLKLDQQTYYGQTNYADDKSGAAALQAEQDQIDAKKKEIEDAQKQVDDAQSKLDAANAEAAKESNSSNSSSSASDHSNSSASNSSNSNSGGSNPSDANSGATSPGEANPAPPPAPSVPADNETVPVPN